MTSALAHGLMGMASGALKGAHDVWSGNMEEARTSRLIEARARAEASLREIEAQYKGAEAEREREHDFGLEERKTEAANARHAETQRTSKENSERAAQSRIEAANISASRPRSGDTPSKDLFYNEADPQEQVWLAEGDDVPAGFYRAPASGAPKDAASLSQDKARDAALKRVLEMYPEDIEAELEARGIEFGEDFAANKRALGEALTKEAAELYGTKPAKSAPAPAPGTPPPGAVPAGRSPDGQIVYRLKDGSLVTLD